MPFPKQVDIEEPLLKVLVDLGGEGRHATSIRLWQRRFPT